MSRPVHVPSVAAVRQHMLDYDGGYTIPSLDIRPVSEIDLRDGVKDGTIQTLDLGAVFHKALEAMASEKQ